MENRKILVLTINKCKLTLAIIVGWKLYVTKGLLCHIFLFFDFTFYVENYTFIYLHPRTLYSISFSSLQSDLDYKYYM